MIADDVRGLVPGSLITLYELDARDIGGDVMRFHAHSDSSIVFQGREYLPWAITADGFERTGNAQQPMPRLTVGNIGKDDFGNPVVGAISALCAALQDLVGATLTRRRTFGKYLDNQPSADPLAEFPPEVWLVEQKTSESAEAVMFTLSSPMDFDSLKLPSRQIVANICPWLWIGGYRGPYCGYTGTRMFDADGNAVADRSFDKCSGLLSTGCSPRFGEAEPNNFGGFPAADSVSL